MGIWVSLLISKILWNHIFDKHGQFPKIIDLFMSRNQLFQIHLWVDFDKHFIYCEECPLKINTKLTILTHYFHNLLPNLYWNSSIHLNHTIASSWVDLDQIGYVSSVRLEHKQICKSNCKREINYGKSKTLKAHLIRLKF